MKKIRKMMAILIVAVLTLMMVPATVFAANLGTLTLTFTFNGIPEGKQPVVSVPLVNGFTYDSVINGNGTTNPIENVDGSSIEVTGPDKGLAEVAIKNAIEERVIKVSQFNGYDRDVDVTVTQIDETSPHNAIVTVAVTYSRSAPGTPSITIIPNHNAASTASIAIDYTYYKILSASIDADPIVASNGTTTTPGAAAYYVESQAQADAIAALTKGESEQPTALFTVTKVPQANRWYVTANEGVTATNIADAFDNAAFLANFTAQTYTKDASTANAVLPGITAGYYFIKSSLGTKAAVQTLGPVEINEKNSYPGITKTGVAAGTLAGINDTISYTITVSIPESVAEKEIKIVDTITNGLTLNTTATVTGAVANPTYTSATFNQTGTVAAQAATEAQGTEGNDGYIPARPAVKAATKYTITIPEEVVIANKGQTLTFAYTATVNEHAVVLDPESNTAHLEYDHYNTVETETVDTKTLAFTLEKVDGTDYRKDTPVITELAGAEFDLYDDAQGGSKINLIDITEDGSTVKKYRVATTAEAADPAFTSAKIVAGIATIEGLDDMTYYLEETKEPTGYNRLTERVSVSVTEVTAAEGVDTYVENNKGATLPSTGGIGTTIFYIIGAILVIGGGIVLVTRRRMG